MSAEQDELLQQAVKAHKAGDSQAAERLYRSILEIDAAHPDANHNLGVLLVHTQDAKDALPYLKTALQANPKQMQYWLSAIDALITADQIEVARNLLHQGQEKGLKGDQVDKLVARIESSQGSKTSGDTLPPEKKKEILTLYSQGKFEEALDLVTELDQISFDDPNVPNIYALINSELGNYESAVEGYQRAIALKPDFEQAYSNMAIALHKLGKYQESITACNKALELNPGFALAHNNLGMTLNILRRHEEAIASYKKAIHYKPDLDTAYYNLGNATNALGDSDGAIVHYNKATALNPNYTEAHTNLGVALSTLGRYEEADKSFSRAIELDPDHRAAISGKARVLLRCANYKDGLPMLERAEGKIRFEVDNGISFKGGV